jgi:hypothetical protein
MSRKNAIKPLVDKPTNQLIRAAIKTSAREAVAGLGDGVWWTSCVKPFRAACAG